MREIKFRSWLKLKKEFIYDFNIMYVPTLSEDGKIVIQQYIGMEDVDGTEVYEGDIVSGFNRIHECTTKEEVRFLKGCFMIGNWNAHEFFNSHQYVEVVGNVFENSELLEEN